MARPPVKHRKARPAESDGEKPLQRIAAHMEKGGLHRSLGIPMGEKIPASKLEVHSGDSTKLKRQKNLAKTFAKHRPG